MEGEWTQHLAQWLAIGVVVVVLLANMFGSVSSCLRQAVTGVTRKCPWFGCILPWMQPIIVNYQQKENDHIDQAIGFTEHKHMLIIFFFNKKW